MAENPILNELEAAKARVAQLRSEFTRIAGDLKVAEARLDAFQIAAQAFENVSTSPRSKVSAKRKRNRLPTEDWQKVFRTLYTRFENDFGYDEVMEAAEINDIADVKRASLRTKMMNYADGGYVDRKDAGRFAITDKGLPYFKIEAQASKENEPESKDAPGPDAASTSVGPLDLAHEYSGSDLVG